MRHYLPFRLILLVMVIIGCCPMATGQAKTNVEKLSSFFKAFDAANAWERRNLVTKAIDDELLKQGQTTLADARKIFGDHLILLGKRPYINRFGRKVSGVLRAKVFFQPAIQSPNPFESAYRSGWYLELVFLGDRLEYYSLSNVYKEIVK